MDKYINVMREMKDKSDKPIKFIEPKLEEYEYAIHGSDKPSKKEILFKNILEGLKKLNKIK